MEEAHLSQAHSPSLEKEIIRIHLRWDASREKPSTDSMPITKEVSNSKIVKQQMLYADRQRTKLDHQVKT